MVVMYAVGDAHIYTCIVVVQYRIREKMITIVRLSFECHISNAELVKRSSTSSEKSAAVYRLCLEWRTTMARNQTTRFPVGCCEQLGEQLVDE